MTDSTAEATPSALAAPLAQLVGNLLGDLGTAIEDLSVEELNAQPLEGSPSIGFHVWHVLRTVDNIVNFVFHRDRPIWVAEGLDKAWEMPRIDQGTGMTFEESTALQFASVADLAGYGAGVREAVQPKIEAMDEAFLVGTTPARIAGEMTERARIETLGQVVIAHGREHYGQVQVLRQLLGKDALGF